MSSEIDSEEGMDEIALRELVTTLRTRLAEVEKLNMLADKLEQLANAFESKEGYEMEADRLSKQLVAATAKADQVEADAAVMRVALEQSKSVHKKQFVGPIDADFVEHQNAFEACRAALATDAGKSLLERQKEAEWLLLHSNDLPHPDDWFDRRDAFLNPNNKDVK